MSLFPNKLVLRNIDAITVLGSRMLGHIDVDIPVNTCASATFPLATSFAFEATRHTPSIRSIVAGRTLSINFLYGIMLGSVQSVGAIEVKSIPRP